MDRPQVLMMAKQTRYLLNNLPDSYLLSFSLSNKTLCHGWPQLYLTPCTFEQWKQAFATCQAQNYYPYMCYCLVLIATSRYRS